MCGTEQHEETEEMVLMDVVSMEMEDYDKFVDENGEEVDISIIPDSIGSVSVNGEEMDVKQFLDEIYGKTVFPAE